MNRSRVDRPHASRQPKDSKPWCTPNALSGTRPKILFVGQAPGDHEIDKNHPFVGPSGQHLIEALTSKKLRPAERLAYWKKHRSRVAIINVFRDKEEKSETKSRDLKKALSRCDVVVILGKRALFRIAAHCLDGKEPLKCKIVWTFHPSPLNFRNHEGLKKILRLLGRQYGISA